MTINSWGSGTWGTGYWGSEQFNILQSGRNITEAEQQWESAIEFGPGSNMYKLLTALLTVGERMDADLEEIYEQTHVNSATGKELDQFGQLVNVRRETNEDDDRYRARIKAAFRASTIATTFDQFTEFCATVLSTDIENIDFSTNYDGNPATVTVSAPATVYDDLNLTPSDVDDLLGRGVPAGHEVNTLESGTFRLKSIGDADDPAEGLTSDSISTGGTLAEDLV